MPSPHAPCSTKHCALQPSKSRVFASSHSSPAVVMPSPQYKEVFGSRAQDAEHPSAETVFRSSHVSPLSKKPLPQIGVYGMYVPGGRTGRSTKYVTEDDASENSTVQFAAQPSPEFLLPSSHCSGNSGRPLPHTRARRFLSRAHCGPQPSFAVLLPSSHSSPAVRRPSPQNSRGRLPAEPPRALLREVDMPEVREEENAEEREEAKEEREELEECEELKELREEWEEECEEFDDEREEVEEEREEPDRELLWLELPPPHMHVFSLQSFPAGQTYPNSHCSGGIFTPSPQMESSAPQVQSKKSHVRPPLQT